MSGDKALNPLEEQRKQATARWLAAQEEHRRAHSTFYRIRTQLPPESQRNAVQRDTYNMARALLSQATKKRTEEEQLFNIAMNPLLSQPAEVLTEAMHGMVENFLIQMVNGPASVFTNLKAVQEEQELKRTMEMRAEASPEVKASLEAVRKYALARKEGRVDVFGNILEPGEAEFESSKFMLPKRPEGYQDPTAPEGTYDPYVPSEPELDPMGEPIDDAMMDTDPAPEAPLPQVLPEPKPTPEPLQEPLPTRRKASPQIEALGLGSTLHSNPIFAEIAKAAAEFVPPPPEDQAERKPLLPSYEEYLRTRENTPEGDSKEGV